MKIEIDPIDLENAVKDAILNSALGKFLKEAVANATKDYTLTRAVEDVINRQMSEMAKEAISNDPVVQEKIKELVYKYIATPATFEKLAEKVVRNLEY